MKLNSICPICAICAISTSNILCPGLNTLGTIPTGTYRTDYHCLSHTNRKPCSPIGPYRRP